MLALRITVLFRQTLISNSITLSTNIKKFLKGLGENIIDIEKIKKQFEELGLEYDKELSKLRQSIHQFNVPRITVKENQFHIRCDDSYLENDVVIEHFEAIVMEEQVIRALFDKKLVCFSIDSKPKTLRPRSYCCDHCAQTKCALKVRLWLWIQDKPFVPALSPDVMTNWDAHKLKCFNGRLPLIAVNTVFSAESGKVIVDINGTANKEALVTAVQVARTELSGLMGEVTEKDFPEFNG